MKNINDLLALAKALGAEKVLAEHPEAVLKVAESLNAVSEVLEGTLEDVDTLMSYLTEVSKAGSATDNVNIPTRDQMIEDLANYARNYYGNAQGWDDPARTASQSYDQIKAIWDVFVGNYQ